MAISIYNITTNSGTLSKWVDTLSFLSDEETIEFNKIGYSGKNILEQKTNFSEYLNSLNKGEFEVQQTKFDNGDFTEKYTIVRVTK